MQPRALPPPPSSSPTTLAPHSTAGTHPHAQPAGQAAPTAAVLPPGCTEQHLEARPVMLEQVDRRWGDAWHGRGGLTRLAYGRVVVVVVSPHRPERVREAAWRRPARRSPPLAAPKPMAAPSARAR
eukprot:1474654-Prymnesium_polylepis.1